MKQETHYKILAPIGYIDCIQSNLQGLRVHQNEKNHSLLCIY